MGLAHRERVLMALDHKEPDRAPVDLGGYPIATSINVRAYEKLLAWFSIQKELHIGSTSPVMTELISPILDMGFNGLHGLSPSVGNDLLSIRKQTRGKLCLMGVFQVDCLDSRELEASKKTILPLIDSGGGYVLGSSEGLSKNTPLNSVRTLYELQEFSPCQN
jgi:hypothetical protein